MLRGADVFLIPSLMFWLGFTIVWETAVLNSLAPVFFRLWDTPFVITA
jgi:hypothetical protein